VLGSLECAEDAQAKPLGRVDRSWGVVGRAYGSWGADRTYMGGTECGGRNISLVNIKKIAKALEISLSDLFRRV